MSALTLIDIHDLIKEIKDKSDCEMMVILKDDNSDGTYDTLVDLAVPEDGRKRQASMLSMLECAIKTTCAELIKSGMDFERAGSLVKFCTLMGIAKTDEASGCRHED